MRGIGAALLALTIGVSPAMAGQAGDILRGSLYGGTLSLGQAALQPMADAGDQEAKFGLGFLQLLTGLEAVTQALYRHGLAAPETGPMGPVLGIPMPENTDPEPLDYGRFRAMLQGLVDQLDAAKATFLAAGESGDYVIDVDPLRIRLDVNGDGKADEGETVAAVVGIAVGDPTLGQPQSTIPPDQPDGTRRRDGGPAQQGEPQPPATIIGFDRADAIWLAGYSNVFAGQADYLLAHDFSGFFDATFHRFFPRAGLLMQQYARGGQLVIDPETDTAIADAIAGIHTLDWPVTDPARLKHVLERAKDVTQLSRRNWEAILAETDDHAELVPSPTQTGLGDRGVTAEQVEAWQATLDTVDQVLDGELLLPHWRFRQGFDLKAYFETATETDFVMILTGAGAIPFLKDGPIANPESFAAANRAFGTDLIGYALWFN